jgi:hypothetical protein
LILPLPYWDTLSELEALKPLMANQNLPYVERLDVYPVHFDPVASPPTAKVLQELKQTLSSALSHPTFSDPSSIGIAANVTGEAP